MPATIDLFRSQSGKTYMYTGGFENFVTVIDVNYQKLVGTRNVAAMLTRFPDIIIKPMISPFVYSITSDPETGLHLLSLETGNVVGFNDDLLNKPAFCIEGHSTKVVRR